MGKMRKTAIGIDLGGTRVRGALGDNKGRILKKIEEKTEKSKGPKGIIDQIIKIIRCLPSKKVGEKMIEGIGIGSTGPVNLDKGGLMNPTNIPYEFIPLIKPLEKEFNLPIHLLNDCTSAVMGEKYFGLGKKINNLVYITLSTGIGGGVYVDNNLLLGKDGNAHEIGHITIDFEGRLTCGCGKQGHWEAYCSGNGIPNYVKFLFRDKPESFAGSYLIKKVNGKLNKLNAKILFDTAKSGDQISLNIIKKIGMLNAIGFASVIDVYDPELITVGGSIALNNTELVIDPIKRYVAEHARNRVSDITISPLGDDIVLFGALAMCFHLSGRRK
jgi:glucokinase